MQKQTTKVASITKVRSGPLLSDRVERVLIKFLADTEAESTLLSRRCLDTVPQHIRVKFQDNT